MSHEELFNSADRQKFTVTKVLYGGLLPARYLNSFNAKPEGTEIRLFGAQVIEVNKTAIWLNDAQSFALNALAVCVNSTVSTKRLSEASLLHLPTLSAQRFAMALHHLTRRLGDAADRPIFDINRGKAASWRLHSVYFSQAQPSRNELFYSLPPETRKRFGQRVLELGLGEELAARWQPPHTRPTTNDPTMWRLYAQCKDEYEMFLSESTQEQEKAKRICELCTVQDFCLEEALINQEPVGVWGGLTIREREMLIARTAKGNND